MKTFAIVLCLLAVSSSEVLAGAKTTMIADAVKYALKRGGLKATRETTTRLTRQAGKLAAKYGDDGLAAFRKVGSRSLTLADEAGELGGQAVKAMARYGDDAVGIVANPSRLSLYARYGDDAAKALMKHGQIAEPVIKQFGRHAATATAKLSGRNARRLAIMATKDKVKPELVGTLAKHGDVAMDFVWRNKAALTTAAALAAFVNKPDAFLDGSAKLADVTMEHTVSPLFALPREVAAGMNWTLIAIVLLPLSIFAAYRRFPHWFTPAAHR